MPRRDEPDHPFVLPPSAGAAGSCPRLAAALALVLLAPTVGAAQELRGTLGTAAAATAGTPAPVYEDDFRRPAPLARQAIDEELLGPGSTILQRVPSESGAQAAPAGVTPAPGTAPAAVGTPTTPATAAATAAADARRSTDPRLRRDAPRPQTRGPIVPIAPVGPSVATTGSVAPRAAITPDPRDARAVERQEAETPSDELTPLGLRIGSMTWYPAIDLAVGGTSNVDGRANGRRSSSWSLAPELIGRSDWARHALEVRLRGAFTGFPVEPNQNRPKSDAELRGRVDLGELTRLDLVAGFARERQSTSTPENAGSTIGPDQDTATASLGLTREVGMLALTLRGDVARTDYRANTAIAVGGTDPAVQNNTLWTLALRSGFDTGATLRPFVETRASVRRYDGPDGAGVVRDTDGAAVVAGLAIDAGPMLRGEMSTGWGFEKPKAGTLATQSGWLFDGKIVWSPSRLVVVKVGAKTTFAPTTLAGSPGAVSREISVAIDYALRRDLVAGIGVGWTGKSYTSLAIEERTALLSGSLTYKASRELQTFVRADWSRNSTTGSETYDVGTVMTGVRLQR